MASFPPPSLTTLFLLLHLLLLLFFFATADKPYHRSFAATVTNKLDEETETHLHFYFHDIVAGTNPTAVRVAQAPPMLSSATGFGAVVMIDDPLTEGPDLDSKLIGRAQGMYALDSKQDACLLMAMNLAFVDGEFNGSSLAVLGRNAVFSDVREMPVVGGSGRFRLARGYALARTHDMSPITGNGVIEYNVTVLHY